MLELPPILEIASGRKKMPNKNDQDTIKMEIEAIELEHRDLDEAIRQLESEPAFDQLKRSRLKKHKLMLKDQIATLRAKQLPDIIA